MDSEFKLKFNYKKILDFKSKTFFGALLGVLGILMDATNFFPDLPKSVPIIVQVIGFVLAAFGVADSAEQSEKSLIEKAKKFFSENFGAGVLLEAIAHLVDRIPMLPDAPYSFVILAQAVGAILIAMGLRNKAAQARLNQSGVSMASFMKYQHLQVEKE